MWQYILGFLAVVLVVGILWVVQPYLTWKKNFQVHEKDSIAICRQGERIKLNQFLQYKQKQQIHLSLVVPSYNQQQRLPVMLDESVAHLNKLNINNEIIIVNDGSKDKTTEVALKKGQQLNANLVVLEYPKNRGKGGAVRAGMAAATGKYILMVDADGATTFSQYDRVYSKLTQIEKENSHPLVMVVGSRKHLEEQANVERKFHRKLVSGVFGFIKTVVCGIKTKDTQCGFKLFTRESAKMLFQSLHIERWAFDIELFVLCNMFNIKTAQVQVEWRDIDGSKLNVIQDSINMFRDVIMIRFLYLLGLWKSTDKIIVS